VFVDGGIAGILRFAQNDAGGRRQSIHPDGAEKGSVAMIPRLRSETWGTRIFSALRAGDQQLTTDNWKMGTGYWPLYPRPLHP